jgi:hypothetical protein
MQVPSIIEHELPTLSDYLCSSPVYYQIRIAKSLVFCVVFSEQLFVFSSLTWYCLSFVIDMVLSVLRRFTASVYPFWYLQTSFTRLQITTSKKMLILTEKR